MTHNLVLFSIVSVTVNKYYIFEKFTVDVKQELGDVL